MFYLDCSGLSSRRWAKFSADIFMCPGAQKRYIYKRSYSFECQLKMKMVSTGMLLLFLLAQTMASPFFWAITGAYVSNLYCFNTSSIVLNQYIFEEYPNLSLISLPGQSQQTPSFEKDNAMPRKVIPRFLKLNHFMFPTLSDYGTFTPSSARFDPWHKLWGQSSRPKWGQM